MAWRAPCPEGEQRVKARGASTSVVRIRRTDLHLGGGLGIPGSCAPSPILPLLLSCGRVVVSEGGVCAPVLGAVTVWEGAACLPGWQTSEGPAGRGDEGGMKPRVQESCHQVGGREPGPMARRLPNLSSPGRQMDRTPAKASCSLHAGPWLPARPGPRSGGSVLLVAPRGSASLGARITSWEAPLCPGTPEGGTQSSGPSTVTPQDSSRLTHLEHTLVSSLIV